MTLTYSAYEPSGTVLVWQEGECAEFTSVYADLTGSKGAFGEKVSRAREIVAAVNHARAAALDVERECAERGEWSNTDYPPSFKREPQALAECFRCGDLYMESELLHTDCPEDASGRGGRIIDPTCALCLAREGE